MLSAKVRVLAVEVGILAIIGAAALYLIGLIDLNVFMTVAGFFGYGSLEALRSLFLSEGIKTKVIWIIGWLLVAVFGYGNLAGLSWATAEKFGVLFAVVAGIQGIALIHGVAKAGGRSELKS
jgi:hypothetical protein